MSRMEELDAVYIESGIEAYEMCQRLERDYNGRYALADPVLYIGLDTETEPGPVGIPDDALRWWGENPGRPFLYIVGWSTHLGTVKPTYFAIPEEFEWAFRRVADFANQHTDNVEWVFFNRIFDLGMVEISAGIKLDGRTHEAFTAMRVASFLPDWFEANKLKVIAETFLDPLAAEPEDRLKMWKAAYESNKFKDLTARLQRLGKNENGKMIDKSLKFTRSQLNLHLKEDLELPLHVKHLYEQWQKDWPPITYSIIPREILVPYAVNDVRLTLWEFWVGMTLIKERQVEHIYQEEQDLFATIRDQVIRGWAVNRVAINKAIIECVGEDGNSGRIGEITNLLLVLTDYYNCDTLSEDQRKDGFNPGSGNQMLKLFANIGLHVENLKATTLLKWVEDDKGQRTRWADAIESYQEYKLYTKLYGTYVDVLNKWSQWDGICHPSIRPDGAYTGRQSVRQPALQTIPRKEVPEFNIRQFFVPAEPGTHRLWMFDFSGMEVGVFAEYCRDPVMLDALAKGADFHSMLALKAFEAMRELVEHTLRRMFDPRHNAVTRETLENALHQLHTDLRVDFELLEQIKEFMERILPKEYKKYKKYRQAAKTGMFSILYGSGDDTLAEQMTELSGIYISPYVAHDFKIAFFDLYTGARSFVNICNEQVSLRHALAPIHQHNRTYGWARNLYGRLYLVEKRDSYKLPNWLVQGTCADLMKRKMIEVWNLLKGTKSRIILSIHDEIVFELHKDEEQVLVPKIKAIMEDIPEFEAVRLKIEASFCPSHWASKTKFHSWEQMKEVLKAA